ncbi:MULTISPECIES: hypothetical protein [Protofrankia]|uniref:IraD/Gp25-like domain-containing protein n=1 Tax=Protofrankia coriariae TaxID=1562887 RepID=A0ABR5EYS6_9ACTN|nr:MULTISPECIES: hypothetical protein [Protofrankia]KLL09615.1 hypothetical protein FrCorBMG51_23750 [Protofrankia coriariae]ONH34498.1 hypothetical protein BL254_15710 [Protofrankia sp. BMG5.30]
MSADPGVTAPPDSAHGQAVLGRAVLGRGLALVPVPGGQPAVDLAWGAGGPRLVEGPDNLAQDLAVALLTPVGSDLFDTGFGFDGLRVLALALGPLLRDELLRVAVVRTLLADARVVDVVDVTLEPLDASRRQVVRATVRTVLGTDVPMTLGEVDLG